MKRTPRGFAIYDERVDHYGKSVCITESSSTEPGIWIQPEVHSIADVGRVQVHTANLLFTPREAVSFAFAIIRAALTKWAAR